MLMFKRAILSDEMSLCVKKVSPSSNLKAEMDTGKI